MHQFLIHFKRAFVFIDGSNFYFDLRELNKRSGVKFSLLNFKFREFAQWLVKPNQLKEIRYYIGAVKLHLKNEKSEEVYLNQQKLLKNLRRQKIDIILGQVIQHPDKSYHEKGVDVRLAVEMIRFARLNKYDIAYLISSDTDLVPAVEEVKSLGKKVYYVGISKGESFGLGRVADKIKMLTPKEIKKFLS